MHQATKGQIDVHRIGPANSVLIQSNRPTVAKGRKLMLVQTTMRVDRWTVLILSPDSIPMAHRVSRPLLMVEGSTSNSHVRSPSEVWQCVYTLAITEAMLLHERRCSTQERPAWANC